VNLPIILYNVPGRTGVDLSNDTVLRLSEVSNIVAIKDATGDVARGAELISRLPETFSVFSGDDETALELMRVGAKGNVSVTANIAAPIVAEVCRLALAGDFDAAMSQNDKIADLNSAQFLEANPIRVKWAMAEANMIDRGIRLPLTELDSSCHERVRAAMTRAGLL